MTSSIEEQFSQLEDPRVEGKQLHGFADILILVIYKGHGCWDHHTTTTY